MRWVPAGTELEPSRLKLKVIVLISERVVVDVSNEN